MQVQIEQGKVAAAESTLALFERKLPTHGDIPASRAVLALAKGNLAAADSILRNSVPTLRTDDARRTAAFAMSNILTARGRVREGMKWTAQAIPTQGGPAALNAGRLSVMLDSAWVEAYYLNDAATAKATMKRAFERIPTVPRVRTRHKHASVARQEINDESQVGRVNDATKVDDVNILVSRRCTAPACQGAC